eukprot:CAMPEP_0172321638 /NCGR_PEP_ID=MMETSP1058-20130122/43927_1 /TAXON_ID=83371 /ORGANISM="Detonula confervacea, Strain CCMP 353" /LENGTH=399 /DNA_ID=CAMNT_0013037205 /DNA_START=53 /DNA_END=1252 /DNA_ORIENTATION=-
MAGADASFFDASNEKAKEMREQMAMDCLEEVLKYVSAGPGCRVGILDATNTTVARRKKLIDRIATEAAKDPTIKLLFVESCADDPELLENNYRMKLANDDYVGMDPDKALADFRQRVEKYEAVYEEISDEADGSNIRYIKLVNAGEKLISKGIDGFIMRKVQRLLGSTHLFQRSIWLVLTGETENDIKGILGGNTKLSAAGQEYAAGCAQLIHKREKHVLKEDSHKDNQESKRLTIYTGTMTLYHDMANKLLSGHPDYRLLPIGANNDLCAGLMDSLSYLEREERFPEEMTARRDDKLNYRYPGVGGESYQDLVARCNDVTCYLEQSRGNSVLIADRAVFRCVSGYFSGKSIEEIPHLVVQAGVLELRRNDNGFVATHFPVTVGKATSSSGAGTARYEN